MSVNGCKHRTHHFRELEKEHLSSGTAWSQRRRTVLHAGWRWFGWRWCFESDGVLYSHVPLEPGSRPQRFKLMLLITSLSLSLSSLCNPRNHLIWTSLSPLINWCSVSVCAFFFFFFPFYYFYDDENNYRIFIYIYYICVMNLGPKFLLKQCKNLIISSCLLLDVIISVIWINRKMWVLE